MSNSRRSLMVALIAAGAMLTIFVAVLGWTVMRAGAVEIRVAEAGPGGHDLHIVVPGIFLQAGVHAVPDRVFAEIRGEMAEELHDYWPAIEAFCKGLRECPDGVFVQVESANERVEIVKRGGHLLIEVEDGDEHVRVSVPLNCMRSIVGKIAPRA